MTPQTRCIVEHRDHGQCRVPSCRAGCGIDLHHIIERQHGGSHEADDLLLLCSAHHTAVLEGRLVIHGDGTNARFERPALDAMTRLFERLSAEAESPREARKRRRSEVSWAIVYHSGMAMAAWFEGVHCSLQLRRPADGVVALTLVGTDVGELGRAPFHALEEDVTRGEIDLFIDARHGRSASVDVSGDWALFFRRHRDRIRSVHMLVTTTFIRMSAESVRRFAAFEDRMHIHTDPSAFERALGGRVLSS